MANEGNLEITLLDVSGAEAADPDTRLTVKRGSSQDVVKVFRTSFPPARQFSLPAFPTEHVLAPFIEPSRYRSKPLPILYADQRQDDYPQRHGLPQAVGMGTRVHEVERAR